MFEFVSQHQFWTAVALYWIFSAAVSSMPDPGTNGDPAYLLLFRFLHSMAGNIRTVLASKIPGLKIPPFLLMFPLLLAPTACAAHYTVHPGAVNKTDSAAYDTLLTAEAAIDQARIDYKAGRLPAGAQDALNTLIHSYNVAREAWLTYRGAVATNTPTQIYFDQLGKNLSELSAALHSLEEGQ